MNRVLQPRPSVVLGLNVWMGTAAGADELVEVPYTRNLNRELVHSLSGHTATKGSHDQTYPLRCGGRRPRQEAPSRIEGSVQGSMMSTR